MHILRPYTLIYNMIQEKMDTSTSRLFLRVTRRSTQHTSLVQIPVNESGYEMLEVSDDDDCLIYYDPGENAKPVSKGKPL